MHVLRLRRGQRAEGRGGPRAGRGSVATAAVAAAVSAPPPPEDAEEEEEEEEEAATADATPAALANAATACGR